MPFTPSQEHIDYSSVTEESFVVHDSGVGIGSLLFEEADYNKTILAENVAFLSTATRTATIDVDGAGAPQPVSLDTVNGVTTYQDLVDEINADTTGLIASIVNGQIRVTSDTPEIGTIDIVDVSLFTNSTGFVDIIKHKHLIDWESIGGPFNAGLGSQLQNILEDFVNTRGGTALPLNPYAGFQVMNTGLAGALDTGLPSQTVTTAGVQTVDLDGVAGVDLVHLANETTEITAVADVAGSLGGTHFLINQATSLAPDEDFYVWIDVDNGSVDPSAANPGRTGIEVDIAANASNTTVALAVQTAVDGVAGFTATLLSTVITVVNDVAGEAVNAADVDTGFSLSVLRKGSNPGIAEVTDVTTVADLAGSLAGSFFLLTAPGTEGNNFNDFYVWYDVGASAETAEVVTIADVEGSLSGTRYHIDGDSGAETQASYVWFTYLTQAEITDVVVPAASVFATDTTPTGALPGSSWQLSAGVENTRHHVWYSVEIAEVTDVTVVADVEGSLGGTHWLLSAAVDATDYYVWYDFAAVAEIYDVETVADVAGSLNSTFFLINDPTTAYYVWYDVNAAGVDPAPGGTGITVALATNDGADAVATATRAAVGAFGDFSTGGATNVVTITNANTGFVADAVDGSAATGFTFPAVTTQGSATQSDPTVALRTGISVTLLTNDADTAVATKTATAIDLIGDFGAAPTGAVVTVTNAAIGATTDTVDVDAGVTPSVTTQGTGPNTDPGGTANPLGVIVLPTDADTAVAVATRAIVTGDVDFAAVGAGATVAITNAATGFADNAADVDASLVSATVTQEGSVAGTDPMPGGRTAITVTIGTNDTANTIAGLMNTVVDASLFYASSVVTNTVTIASEATGTNLPNAVDIDTGFTITTIQEGGVDPVESDPGLADRTGITVTILSGDDPTEVAVATVTAIDANLEFGATNSTNVVTITNAKVGQVSDARDGNIPTGFSFDITTQGGDGAGYRATLSVDGGLLQSIDIAAAHVTDYDSFVIEFNDQTTGVTGALSGGDFVVTSATSGANSSVSIVDTNLFSNMLEFINIDAAVDGLGVISFDLLVSIDGGAFVTLTTTPVALQDFDALVADLGNPTGGVLALDSDDNMRITSSVTPAAVDTVSTVEIDLSSSLLSALRDADPEGAAETGFTGLDESQPGAFDTRDAMNSTFATGGNQSLSDLVGQHVQKIPTRPAGQINASIYFDGLIFRFLVDGVPV